MAHCHFKDIPNKFSPVTKYHLVVTQAIICLTLSKTQTQSDSVLGHIMHTSTNKFCLGFSNVHSYTQISYAILYPTSHPKAQKFKFQHNWPECKYLHALAKSHISKSNNFPFIPTRISGMQFSDAQTVTILHLCIQVN